MTWRDVIWRAEVSRAIGAFNADVVIIAFRDTLKGVGTPAEMADAVVMIVAFWVTVGLFCVVVLWSTRERRE